MLCQRNVMTSTISLEYQPKLSHIQSHILGTRKFGAINTGSLFPVPSRVSVGVWGGVLLNPNIYGKSTSRAGLEPTLERFDGNEGRVEYREGKFQRLILSNCNEHTM